MATTDMESRPLAARRFSVPIDQCDVVDKKALAQYRTNWLKWMSWYEHTPDEPNSIESQIQRMIFNDLTYRASVSVRGSVSNEIAISARSPTLAYLIDQGYVLTQILAIQRLLDDRADVISIRRLLKDVEKNHCLITREMYVSGDGTPYDYSFSAAVPRASGNAQNCGLEPQGFAQYGRWKHLQETFDLLSGRPADQRTRNDTISKSIFQSLNNWISGPSAQEIRQIRDKFIAHSADAVTRRSLQFTGVKFSQIDGLQRAIIRVERALTDYILSNR
jgi:hypothetical protein